MSIISVLSTLSNHDNSFTLTAFLALWGALLSSITFGWNLLRDMQDRAKVRLSANVRKIVVRTDGVQIAVRPDIVGYDETDPTIYVVVSVVNVGRRPLRWSGMGGEYKNPVNSKNIFFVNTRHLPIALAESEAHDEYMDITEEFEKENIKRLYIWDSFDRKWEISKRNLRELAKDASRFKNSGRVSTK